MNSWSGYTIEEPLQEFQRISDLPVRRAITGYGTRAIRSLVPYELGGAVELFFHRRLPIREGIEWPDALHLQKWLRVR